MYSPLILKTTKPTEINQMNKSTFKSIRLSEAVRNNIVDSMMESWVKNHPSPRPPIEIEKQIGDELWLNNYGSIKNHLKKIPESMLRTATGIKVQVAGVIRVFEMSERRPHPYKDKYDTSIVQVLDEPSLNMLAHAAAKEKYNDWEESRIDFKGEIKTILHSVQTSGQLVQLWPEAEQYLPPFAADPSKGINLPALKTSRLNAMLGIK